MYGTLAIDDLIPEMAEIDIKDSECIFFILGAGASVDSNLPTYRGPGGLYISSHIKAEDFLSVNSSVDDIWTFLDPLYSKIKNNKPGPTYQNLKKFANTHPRSFILTQNIDNYATDTELPVIEMHGSWKTMTCLVCKSVKPSDSSSYKCSCGGFCRPDIVLFDEKLPKEKVHQLYSYIKRRPTHVIVIGTSLQFPYLRVFINKAKQRGAKVIHINPAEDYGENVKKNEIWHKLPSSEALTLILSQLMTTENGEQIKESVIF
jgi:NAD-dependent deacetylase